VSSALRQKLPGSNGLKPQVLSQEKPNQALKIGMLIATEVVGLMARGPEPAFDQGLIMDSSNHE
jgi:hypothetical protein